MGDSRNANRAASIKADNDDPLYTAIGRKMAELRQALELTQRDVSRAMGMHDTSVCLYEAGRNRLSLGIFVRWCEALGVPADVVLKSAQQQVERESRVPRQRKGTEK